MRYCLVGGLLIVFTVLTVALSYVDFGGFFSWLFHINIAPSRGGQLNIAVAMLVASIKVVAGRCSSSCTSPRRSG